MAGNKIRSAQANILHQSDTAPSAPSTGQLWWETDTNILWFWNGAYWLSCQMYSANSDSYESISATKTYYTSPLQSHGIDVDIYVVNYYANVMVGTTNDGTHYWDLIIYVQHTGGSPALFTLSTGTAPITAGAWTELKNEGINTHYNFSSYAAWSLVMQAAKFNSPGALFGSQKLEYRLAHV